MRWHKEVLERPQLRVLKAMGPAMTRAGLYLGGGTAVALHLGHRRSDDLDWFGQAERGDMLSLVAELAKGGLELEVEDVQRGTVHGSVSGMRTSVLTYAYPFLNPPSRASGLGCKVASLEDLAAMKLSAVTQRGSRKDFLDVFAIGLERIPLPDMLELYSQRYRIENLAHVLIGLTYFDDADKDSMPLMLWDVGWAEVKRALREWVKELTRLG
jgi:hypothetical protein